MGSDSKFDSNAGFWPPFGLEGLHYSDIPGPCLILTMSTMWKILPSRGNAKAEDGEASAGSPPRLPKIASRIAKAFGKSKEARPTCEQCGPLLSLPYELLEQILDKVDSKKDLCSLRSTCTQLNEYLEPSVWEDLVIDSAQRGSHKTGDLIKALASEKIPCSSWTTTLHINSMVIFSSSTQANWKDPNMDSRLKPLQDHYIAPGFKSLRNLKRVHWKLKLYDPYATTVEGLAAVPSLEELFITFDHWASASIFPLDKFSNLTVLSLEEDARQWGVCRAMTTMIRKAIQASPNLVDLRIAIRFEDTTVTLDDIFGETLTMPALEPRLQHLRALDEYWVSFRHSGGVLSHLTSLEIPNLSPERTFGLWNVLATRGIRLLSITVVALSSELVRFLTSFVGLQKLHIKCASFLEDTEGLSSQLYNNVLPQHQATLTTFLLRTDHNRSRYKVWCAKPADLEIILQCRLLVKLSFPLLYYAPGASIPLAEKLASSVPVQNERDSPKEEARKTEEIVFTTMALSSSQAQPMTMPEPMNASPHHSKVKISVTLADRLFIAGGYVAGKVEMECRADKGLGIGVIMLELFATQGLKRLFQGPGLPPSNAVQARPSPGDPDLPPNYYQARRGLSTFLFRIPIPEGSPSSINFGSGLAQVRYEIRATVGVVWKDDRRLVVDKHGLDVVAAYPYEEIVGLKSPEGVLIGENGKLWLHGKLVGPVVVAGESACIELHVKNHSNKKNTALSLSLNRTLVLPGMSKLGKQALELTDTLTHVPFRGPEYIIPPGAEGVANLVFDVPKHSRGVRGGTLEGDEADPPRHTESLFEIHCTVDIKMSMGFGNKDLLLSVPISIVHPKAVPPPQQLPIATGMGIMSPAVPYPTPAVGAPYGYDAQYANPHLYANPAAYPALPMSPPPSSRPLPFLVDHQQNQVWIPPPAPLPTPMTPQPFLQHGYPHAANLLYQPHASPPRGQHYMAPPPIPPYLTRPSSAGGNVSLPDTYTLPVVQNVPGLPPPSTHDLSQVQRSMSPPTQNLANTSLDIDAEEGKGQRASRVSHHLRLSSRTRSVSPQSHRFPLLPTAAGLPPPPALDANSPPGSAAVSPLRGLPRSPEGVQGAQQAVPPPGPIALSPSTRTINGSLSPTVPARRPGTGTVVHSPRPQLTPKQSFSNDNRPKSERVEELERMASVVALQTKDLSADIPKDDVLHAVSVALDSYQKEVKEQGKAEGVKNDQLGANGGSKDPKVNGKKKKKVREQGEDGSPEINKTLPAPPVPTRKKKVSSALSISPSSSRPKIDNIFDPVSPALTTTGASSDRAPTLLPLDRTPRTPTLTAVLPTRYPRTKLGNFLGVNNGGESGLDALERKLLAQVGTRKFDDMNEHGKKNDERPDIRDVMASFDGDYGERIGQGKAAGLNGGVSGEVSRKVAPIDIPVPIQSPDPANDSAISSLTLGNHEVEADPRSVEGAAGVGVDENERNGLGLMRVNSGGLDLGGGNDSDMDIEVKTHRGGSISGDERVRSWNVSSIPLFDEEEVKVTTKSGTRHRREEADSTTFRVSTPTKLSNGSGKSGKDGKSKKKRDRIGKDDRAKSRTEAKGRVAAWLGG
ncbi:hypothetical protein EST38_g8757, partial [Candolleomyces aberdarensis]